MNVAMILITVALVLLGAVLAGLWVLVRSLEAQMDRVSARQRELSGEWIEEKYLVRSALHVLGLERVPSMPEHWKKTGQ